MDSSLYAKFSVLSVTVDKRVAHLAINHPPINLLDDVLAQELDEVTRLLEQDSAIGVVVLESQNPDFFIAHSGLARVGSAGKTAPSMTTNFRQTQLLTERLRNMPKVTIAKVSGIARGGGNEIVLGADMCFADRDKAIFGQPEVGIGLVPGGGSTQRLPSLVGRSRALEILLGGQDFSATDAERYGWINRALSTEELDPFVDGLARRIASYPPHTIAHIKAAVNRGAQAGLPTGLLEEARQADLCVGSDVTRKRVAEGLQLGLETHDGEVHLPAILDRLTPADQ